MGRTEAGAGTVELGELEQLTISNDNELHYDQVSTEDKLKSALLVTLLSLSLDDIKGSVP